MEAEIGALQTQVSDANFFSRPHEETQQVLKALANAEQALEVAFARWEELEAQKTVNQSCEGVGSLRHSHTQNR